MQFAEPWWMLGGVLVGGIMLLLWWQHDSRQRQALAKFAAAHLHVDLLESFSAAKRFWRRALLLASVLLAFVALARPQWGYKWQEIKRHGVEIIFAIDTSKSMLTPDVKPDRLTRAKLAISDFVNKLDGDGVGLVAFAGTAFLQCPITLDYDAFNDTLESVDTNTIPRGGTDIARAIRETEAAWQQRGTTEKIMVLLTDGEDLEGDAKAAAEAASHGGLKIFTVGVGTANGDLIPVDGGGFLKDDNGQIVRSRLDEAGLKAIAEVTGGIYAPLGTQGDGLETIYQRAIAPLAKHELASRRLRIFTERYQWPLSLALILLLASTLLGTRRETQKTVSAAPKGQAAKKTLLNAASLFLVFLIPARASVGGAEKAYTEGDYEKAEKEYAQAAESDPSKAELNYNLGAAAYKKGDYAAAAKAFQQSLSGEQSGEARKLAVQQNTYYNLGNTLYRAGEKSGQANPQETIKAWEQAVKSYETALQLRADDADAKYNRDLVQKKLDELKKQNPQDQKNSSDKNSEKNKDSQSQNSGSPSDNGQPKSGQDQSAKSPDQNGANSQANNQSGQDQKTGQAGKDQSAANNSGTNGQDQKGQSSLPPSEVKPPGSDQNKASPASAGDKDKDQDKKTGDPVRVAGEISAEEARNLLDSMKSEERRYPVKPLTRSAQDNKDDKPLKDW